ncbi:MULTISPECIES: type I glyceraldehyde-3-phosphate dehydrogenase [Streptomyces]|uniref:Type I glyceraldehyde-3-phosphate dehydrogenase n=1 Tax=Streptomyces caniscabiei TaxID=2746961 RepID=A0ABU4N1U7_9ACTN|nr:MULTISPECIES: type I glyceraldehyde-3-phosphate dehydrogenase [Streptomyces]MBE4733516.1 type I glyceraldehyde-3-phosphate dehydrogenase [Streptomyces caniscabiei]MBE4754693.1 type I glyceraldehyde-3-phosphate dehydrogenase [Streptomyces caniscabiei]MBE4768486.1 type I glyceraldehyde-3-phosphate dehydrogenase [Streptomyces caniscabiei]MBE4782011.1 type I glyceraldehyde-3-phosphate dehydrogenase [Streptomyces caniscabiei]MBE4793300.1 type I glyceraldehyde-3-phosphate dehydrogenase [Streptomy
MTVRVGINGFGRIGRTYLRAALARAEAGTQDVEVVAINDITSPATLAHLLEYDSTFGRIGREVSHDDSSITVDGRRITVTAERDPAALRWADHGADIVVESTGRFRDRESAALHLKAGAHTVLLSAPGKGVDATIVMGVNDGTYDRHRDRIVSAASCTTNCVAPMVKVLDDAFGIERGVMTTIHGYTNDQALLDGPHKDLRRARSAALSIIPTSTGAARAVGLVVPELVGALDGIAVRVPVEDGSLTDLAVVLEREATAEEVNAAFATAADGPLHGVLRVSKAPIVSRDVIGDPSSCVFDPALTQVNGTLAKVFGWYDNEWGYTNRLLDLTALVADD